MKWFGVSVAASLLSPLALNAQQTSFRSSGAPAAAKSTQPNEHTLTIDVAVTDKAGMPVRGLQQQNFTLLDDKQPKTLSSFRAVDLDAHTPAPPIEIVLAVYAINADIWKMDRQRQRVKNFLQTNGGKLPLPVSLVVLTDAGATQPITASQNGDALATMLDADTTGVRQVSRTSANGPYERYQLSLQALNRLIVQESAKPGRKLVVWVSPGWPLLSNTASDITSKDQRRLFDGIVATSTALRNGHITLYNVQSLGVAGATTGEFSFYNQFLDGVKSPSQANPANMALGVLAVQSGGLVLNDSNDLPAAIAGEIAKSANDARSFYVLTFDGATAEHASDYHSLQVKVDKPGLTARTRTGYYAQR